MPLIRFSVDLKSVLGYYYYRYDLTSNDYNPSVGSNVVLSCKCTNAIGNAIANKELKLYDNGALVGSATTNSSGVASWTVNLSDWSNHHFVVGNSALDLEATGYKTIAGASTSTYWLVRDKTTATLVLNGWTCGACNTSDWVKFGGYNYASNCRPLEFAMGLANNNNVVFRINYSTGEITYRALKTNQSSTQLYMVITWNIRESDL